MQVLRSRLLEIELEKREAELARLKGDHVQPGWGNQIRSYVLHPYRMAKDLRTNVETSDTNAVLDGEIDGFIHAWLREPGGCRRGREQLMSHTRLLQAVRSCSLLAALALGLALAWPGAADADGIEVSELRVRSADPTAITFSARVAAPEGLQEAELVYRVLNPKEGDVGGSVVREDFAPGREFDVSVTLETRTSQRYIPIGSQFRYHWHITGADGSSIVTEEESYLFLDGRYPWVSVREGDVTVYYYGTAHERAQRVAQAARSAIEDTEELLQVKVPFPTRVMVWASEADGELAMRSRGLVFDELVRTGGQRVGSDLLFVFSATMDVVRHEAAHIVTSVAGDGPFTSIPSWLDEGTAVYMQNSQLGYDDAIAFAIAADRTIRLRQTWSRPRTTPTRSTSSTGSPGPWWITCSRSSASSSSPICTAPFAMAHPPTLRSCGSTASTRTGSTTSGASPRASRRSSTRRASRRPPPPVAEATRAPLAIPTSIGSSGSSGDREEAAPTATPESAAPAATATAEPEPEPEAAAASEDGGGSNTMIAIVIGLVTLLPRRRPRPAPPFTSRGVPS